MQPFVVSRLQPRRLVVINDGSVLVGSSDEPREPTWNVDAIRSVASFMNASTTALIAVNRPRNELTSLQNRRAWAVYAQGWHLVFAGGQSNTYGQRAATLYFLSGEFLESRQLQPPLLGDQNHAGLGVDDVLGLYGDLLPHLNGESSGKQMHTVVGSDQFAEVTVLDVRAEHASGVSVSYRVNAQVFLHTA